jgi:hypothetical protein
MNVHIEDNARQGFVEHFQNLNLEPLRIEDHGKFKPNDLYHEWSNFQIDLKNKFGETTKWK